MSVQIQLHERTEEMHDEMLRSEGIVDGAIGGLMGQLTAQQDYFDEFQELVREADSYIVGSSNDEWPRRVQDLIDGPTEVDDTLIEQARAIVKTHDDAEADFLLWLEQHRGDEVFSIGW